MTTTNTTTTLPAAPDESMKAMRAIKEALASSDGLISHQTARLIAAAIHEGGGSALQHFASTGQFDLDRLGREVTRLNLPPEREPWRQALLELLLSMRRPHPWTRSAVRPRGARRLPEHEDPFSDGERPWN